MTSELGLNSHHQGTVVNYMRFARYQRGQRLRAVEGCFEDLKECRLIEDTFTLDEVTDMLDGLLAVVRGDVETELINTAHTNVLLLRQLCQQAEKWHLKLHADLSELENRELLEQIRDFEDREFSGTKRDQDLTLTSLSKLEPLNETGGAALLHLEIERITEENAMLRDRMKQIEGQAIKGQKERNELQGNLERTQVELDGQRNIRSSTSDQDVADLTRKMSGLKQSMDQSEASNREAAEHLEGNLTSTKHELLKIKEMLEMAEQELERKVNQTAPFKNLKQMLLKKNNQIRELRSRLSRFEGPDDNED